MLLYLMDDPEGVSGAVHSPAAHASTLSSYTALPSFTTSFSLTASQNLLLHSFGYVSDAVIPVGVTGAPTSAPSGARSSW